MPGNLHAKEIAQPLIEDDLMGNARIRAAQNCSKGMLTYREQPPVCWQLVWIETTTRYKALVARQQPV